MEASEAGVDLIVVLLLRMGPIFVCVLFYVASALRLAVASCRAATTRKRRVGTAPRTTPNTTVQNKNNNSLENDGKRKAQWNLLKIATVLFILYSTSYVMKPLILIFDGDYRVIYFHVIVEILIAGINPIVYMLTSSEIRAVIPSWRNPCHWSNGSGNQTGQVEEIPRDNMGRGRIWVTRVI